MSYEDHFMELVKLTPIAERESRLVDIVYDFIDRNGAGLMIAGMQLMDVESENFGCTVRQAMHDVLRRHLELYWLDNQTFWYVMRGEEYPGEPTHYLHETDYYGSRDPDILEDVEAGPFDTEEQAVAWAQENGVALEMVEME
jgi:hypothetical protein